MAVSLDNHRFRPSIVLMCSHRYGAEVLPMTLRSKVMGLAAASHFIVNVGITEAGPTAFANVREVRTLTVHTSISRR
jgi:hypothetical protein